MKKILFILFILLYSTSLMAGDNCSSKQGTGRKAACYIKQTATNAYNGAKSCANNFSNGYSEKGKSSSSKCYSAGKETRGFTDEMRGR